MKAIVWTKYGPPDVLQLREVPTPTPKDDEVLIRVRATTVTAGDCEARSLDFPLWLAIPLRLYMGPIRPRDIILGQELAGDVAAVGKNVTRFREGDRIFGATGFRFGAYAEYTCQPAESNDGVLAPMPANLSYEEAAGVPTGGLEALHLLRLGRAGSGDKVLINGAGGSIGTLGLQLARHFGAEVTAVDSGEKLEMLRALGAAAVVDYTKEDFTQRGETYDIIFDVVGKAPFAGSIRALKPDGRLLLANPRLSAMIRGRWTPARSGKQVLFGAASRKTENLLYLKELCEAGTIKPIVDRAFPLEETAAAHAYVETGRKQGNVIITVAA